LIALRFIFYRPLAIVLAAVFVRGLVWMASIPPWQGPDEPSHFTYIQTLAEDHQLPHLSKDQVSPEVARSYVVTHFSENDWTGQHSFTNGTAGAGEASLSNATPATDRQPGTGDKAGAYSPLYYAAALPFYFIGRPFGIIGSLFAIRVFDVLLGTLAIFFTVVAGRQLWPAHPGWALSAGILTAFQPMFAQETSIVSNDAALIAVGAAFVALALWSLRHEPGWRVGLSLGALAAAGFLIKPTGIILIFSLVPFLLIHFVRRPRRVGDIIREIGGMALSGVVVAGWWVVGSFVARAGTFAQLASQGTPHSLGAYLRLLRDNRFHYLFRAWIDWTWGDFGWLNTPLPMPILLVIEVLVVVLLIGLLIAVIRPSTPGDEPTRAMALFLAATLLIGVAFLQATDAVYFIRTGGVLLQGRYLLLAATAAFLCLLIGALALVPRSWRDVTAIALAGGMVALNILSVGILWQRFYL
jgi:4-amino-4-deoxy-L-arabinose transferase-like glycosyltransferase